MGVMIVFGTESGNAELVAEDLADELRNRGETVETIDMADGAAELDSIDLLLIVCSTHGEGDLPIGAEPFAQWLDDARPDLHGLRYAMFGLGDSSYENYSRGSERIDARLAALGAQRFGEYGRHDANGRDAASDAALAWLKDLRLEDARRTVNGAAGVVKSTS